MSSAIVQEVESAPSAAEPAEQPAAPPPAQPAPVADEDLDVLPVPSGAPMVWLAGAVALALAVALAIAMPRAPKTRASSSSATTVAIATEDEAVEMDPEREPEPRKGTKSSKPPAKDDDSSRDRKPAAKSQPEPEPTRARSEDTDVDDEAARKPDDRPSAKPDDSKRLAEAELAYRDGEQRVAMGDTDGAIASLKHAAELNPSHAPTYRALGDAYAKRGDQSKAKGAYARYLKLAPNARDASRVRDRMNAM